MMCNRLQPPYSGGSNPGLVLPAKRFATASRIQAIAERPWRLQVSTVEKMKWLGGWRPESQLVASLMSGEGSLATPRPRRGRRWRWWRGVAVNLQLRRGKPVGGCGGVGGEV